MNVWVYQPSFVLRSVAGKKCVNTLDKTTRNVTPFKGKLICKGCFSELSAEKQ